MFAKTIALLIPALRKHRAKTANISISYATQISVKSLVIRQ